MDKFRTEEMTAIADRQQGTERQYMGGKLTATEPQSGKWQFWHFRSKGQNGIKNEKYCLLHWLQFQKQANIKNPACPAIISIALMMMRMAPIAA